MSTLGYKHTEATKRKMSEANKGLIPWIAGKKHTDLTKKKIGNALCNRKYPESKKGKNHHLWNGGLTSINQAIRNSLEYREWRRRVFVRDSFRCVMCGCKNKKIHADHIKPFAYYPEYRFDLNNGRTLCVDCHRKTDTYCVKLTREAQLLNAN